MKKKQIILNKIHRKGNKSGFWFFFKLFWKGHIREVIKTCNHDGILEILETIPDEEWAKDTEVRNSKAKVGNTNLDTRALMLKYKSSSATGNGFMDYEIN